MIPQSQNKTQVFSAAGKLMLFGEYLVLNGAKSLSFPLKFGQTMKVVPTDDLIRWEAYSPDGKWFWCIMDEKLKILDTNNHDAAAILKTLFRYIKDLNPELNIVNNFEVKANFNLNWGLGSSSTLISLLAQWSDTFAYDLLQHSFGGSGYDVACATADNPLIYQLEPHQWGEVALSQSITDHFLFVYLGQKQNSRDEIKRFQQREVTAEDINTINQIVDQAVETKDIEEFEALLNKSEDILSPILGREKLKDRIFADYKYSIKSLGAWGGDFFLATFRDLNEAKNYFKEKGLDTMFTYKELVK